MMKQHGSNSYLFGGNAPYVEEMYEAYLDNPGSVADNWRDYFDALQHVPATDGSESRDVAHAPVIESFAQRAKANAFAHKASETDLAIARKQVHVQSLIAAYRSLGSRWADLDPLKRTERPKIPELETAFYDLTEADMDITFSATNTYFTKSDSMTLREIVQALRETYCGTLGAEIMHITEPTEKRWWQERLESIRSKPTFGADKKKHILDRLTAAEGLERFLHTKYVGQKRFSLEGGESFIASMDELVQRAGEQGVQEIVIGMAHRGRLNVLVNTLGKMPKDLFAEFDHTAPEDLPAGDVKYHQGFSSDISTPGGPVHLSLAFNPSHLEIVNPVVEGSVRARQDRREDKTGVQVLPVLVHGDSAFGGQGVNQETLMLAATRGYSTGGTVHIIINNQIGFTTSDPRDLRSTLYCTDIVKMIEAPVLHVNGDDPEAVVLATQLALDYRMTFHKDIVVDVICFRKLGHNEQDTPALTQPLMYKKISAHPGTRRLYADKLATQGLGETLGDDMAKAYRAAMDAGRHTIDPVISNFKSKYAVDWSPFLGKKWTDAADTAIPLAEWKRLATRLTTIPASVNPHPLVKKVYDDRAAMGRGEVNVDWGMGEHMAFASLVAAGYPVRLSGEDCGRGTFTHRHAVVHDQKREKWDEGTYIPAQHVADNQATFTVIDSILSEEAVLGFEYGYAAAEPNTLTIWEAQFGDFANGAQVVIDQFIASGEVKWGRVNGLTLMLPHGYEGQGPEHSSARLERFMQLAADANMQIVQPTTASQIFHVLRRQMVRPLRKPLVLFTPKSLLRNKDATSPVSEFTKGEFRTVIGEQKAEIVAEKVKRVIACSGKVYYDLVKKREEK
ncbi:2-oxoglutarate dehydrogenase E1 component, partial [Sphaerotilus sp.]|uniref:2-oxoglutarate dehydrogenase E1 component n=1 Tax=Sphaerotilus sp. TaxID=2093942 RepID=UPI0025EF1427